MPPFGAFMVVTASDKELIFEESPDGSRIALLVSADGVVLIVVAREVEAPPMPKPIIRNDAAIVIGRLRRIVPTRCQRFFLRVRGTDSALPLSLG